MASTNLASVSTSILSRSRSLADIPHLLVISSQDFKSSSLSRGLSVLVSKFL